MSNALSRKYASALFQLATGSKSDISGIDNELNKCAEFLNTKIPYNILLFLGHPAISNAVKESVVSKALSGTTGFILDFLLLLIRRKKIGLFEDIFNIYLKLVYNHNKQKQVIVESAAILQKEAKSILENKIKSFLSGINPVVEYKTNPGLIGGYIIRIDDTVWDNSIKTKLINFNKGITVI
jgi:F-type H+-transporting ATPase subunit delta